MSNVVGLYLKYTGDDLEVLIPGNYYKCVKEYPEGTLIVVDENGDKVSVSKRLFEIEEA